MARLRYNGVRAALSGSHTNSVTTITLAAALTHSGGTNVPTIASPDYLPLSIHDSNGVLKEVVYLTAYTAGATTGTISRGKEGTTGSAHSSGAIVVLAPLVQDFRAPIDPAVLNATYGDHFTGTDIDTGKWSRAGSYVNADDSANNSWLVVEPGRTTGSYYYQTAPSGDWTIVMKYAASGATIMFGILVTDNSGNGIGAGLYNSGGSNNGPIVGNVSSGAYSSGFQEQFFPFGTGALNGGATWTKVEKSGGGYRTASSMNGEVWGPWTPTHTPSAFTPTRIGFGCFYNTVKHFQVDYFDVQ